MSKKKVNKKIKKLPKLRDFMIMDPANVCGIIPINEDFVDTGKLSAYEDFKSMQWVLSDWQNCLLGVDKKQYYCERTTLTSSYIELFRKLASAFSGRRLDLHSIQLYENKTKNMPAILVWNNLGMMLAPRVDMEGDGMFEYDNYEEPSENPKEGAGLE